MSARKLTNYVWGNMKSLKELKACKDISDIARLIGYEPKKLAYILYKIDDAKKYTSFEIPKATSGNRLIHAPVDELKLAQSRLAKHLQYCLEEIEKSQVISDNCVLAHGFKRKFSIASNASNHVGRKWVLNLDIKDFFPAINFGRVRGFFIKNMHFEMNPKAATILAQIACHENSLPQGAPTSPVISNLITNILDLRLNKIASRHRCTYTRYADDISFSTNCKSFPKSIARLAMKNMNVWHLSRRVVNEVQRSGFEINDKKTRMQYRRSRQDVTGLIVNEKVNIKRERYKSARAQVHSLVTSGKCWQEILVDNKTKKEVLSADSLRGKLSHIFWVKGAEHKYKRFNVSKESEPSFYRDYRKFLDYQTFVDAPQAVLICEGATDNIYIHCAINNRKKPRPKLINAAAARGLAVQLFSYPKIDSVARTVSAVQHLNGGTGDLQGLIYKYSSRVGFISRKGFRSPVILLVDNDQGARDGLFGAVKSISKSKSTVDGSKEFYLVGKNLYVIPTPKLKGGKDSMIEDFLPPAVLKQKLGIKTLNLTDKTFDKSKHFGKRLLAEQIVAKQQAAIDFSGFDPILDRIELVLDDFAKHPRKDGRVLL